MAKKEKSILRIVILFIILLLSAVVAFGIYAHMTNKDGQTRVSNDAAEKDKDGRYLTIINDTNQIINEVHISVGEGTEINHAYQHNPDEKSFSIEIPKSYDKYDEFKITIIDRYGFKYEKQINNVVQHGRTEVKFTKDDHVEQNNDWTKQIDKLFNND